MAGQWSSFELGYTNRDGSIGTDTNLLFVRLLRTLSNGNPIQVRDFTTRSPGIPAATGMGSVFVTLKMADGSVYSSADREERAVIDDGILIVSTNPSSQLTSRILATLTPADTLEPKTRTHQVSTSPQLFLGDTTPGTKSLWYIEPQLGIRAPLLWNIDGIETLITL
jgi:hypothetical protein